MSEVARYGVKETMGARDALDLCCEELRLLGFTTLRAELSQSQLDVLSRGFDHALDKYAQKAEHDGFDLDEIGERDSIRVLPAIAPEFWKIAFDEGLHALLSRMLGDYYILNQVNGLVNRANAAKYAQSSYHRDLPYQHFTSSRPLAINALFAMDDFTLDNGATRAIPASHKMEAFPSDETVRRLEKQIEVPRGTFIVLDCMVYHAGSTNRSNKNRRAVNHVFTIPMLRQQLHLPSVLKDQEFSEQQRKILGYGLDEYRSVPEWLSARRATRKD